MTAYRVKPELRPSICTALRRLCVQPVKALQVRTMQGGVPLERILTPKMQQMGGPISSELVCPEEAQQWR